MAKAKQYTFDEIEFFVRKAANYTANRYRHYGVDHDDLAQEMRLWLHGAGKAKVERWLSAVPQQTTRVYLTLLMKALGYAEQEKAAAVGYDVDDVAWYSPALVEDLLPFALDETFTGERPADHEDGTGKRSKPPQEGGDLLATVMDVRRALDSRSGMLRKFFEQCGPGHPAWDQHVRDVVDWLGGDRPWIGKRRVISNASAQALTSEA